MFTPPSQIGIMRVRGAADRPALRQRLSALAAGIEPPQRMMPPSAILVVRELTDPAPQSWDSEARLVNTDDPWQRLVRERLAAAYTTAGRPRRGRIPASAAAVAFSDWTELLACLCLLLHERTGHFPWWCRYPLARYGAYLRHGGPFGLLRAEPRNLPGVLALLGEWSHLVPLLAGLSQAEATTLARALVNEFGLAFGAKSHLFETRASDSSSGSPVRASASSDGSVGRSRTSPSQNLESSGFWRRELSGRWPLDQVQERDFGKARCLLMGLGLLLHYRSGLVRSPSRMAQIEAWSRQYDSVQRDARGAGPASKAGSNPHSTFLGATRVTAEPDAAPSPATAHASDEAITVLDSLGSGEAKRVLESDIRLVGASDDRREMHQAQARTANAEERRQTEREARPESDWSDPTSPELDRDSPDEDIACERIWLFPGQATSTELGGVFYLINAMAGLSSPFDGTGLSPWAGLEILARGLLDGTGTRHLDDPVWRLLTALDSREPEHVAGHNIALPGEYLLARGDYEQVIAAGEDLWFGAAKGRRARIWSNAGFLLADVAGGVHTAVSAFLSDQHPEGLAPTLLKSSFDQAPRSAFAGPLTAMLPATVRHKLSLWLPFIQRRLTLALPVRDRQTPLAPLFERQAVVYHAPSHIDVVMSLDAVSLPVRMAGLDRNPGWLMTFGRVVSFHFN